jgi:site-specific DNA recombinase
LILRPGVRALLQDAEADRFDRVLAEALDRVSRDQAETDAAALAKVEKGIVRMIAAIEDVLYQSAMKARMRMTELERQKAEIAARLAQAPRPAPIIHPNMAQAYLRKVERLVGTLDHPEVRHEAASALRSIISRIVLTPGEKRGQLHASLHGEFPAIMKFANDNVHFSPAPLVMLRCSRVPGMTEKYYISLGTPK